ncbi:MAG TPA: ABC transporter substrate-binding protein [Frankiaceae bacterium]|jgi:ABC-type branched-subunit amino acid transport system substrate-binding protein|nr:ABC transporter substrate-binding protein [Frankiaceae bacterium]
MHSRHTRRASSAIALLAVASLGIAACGRSSSGGGGGTNPSSSAAGSASAAPTSAPAGKGDFGDLKAVCGPGTAKGATGRGVTDTTIRIGTTADPGAAAAPGLEQEFFDTADAFSKWCNAAGGINGRKIVVDKWDAKLFNVGQAFTNACQKDFMLVGNGNAFDSAGVKPRLGCKLGDIYSYTVSPEASTAALQVAVTPSNPTQYPYGPLRLLVDAYPASKSGVGVGSSTLASLIPQGKRIEESLKNNGVKVSVVQEQPPLVPNYRPYVEQLKSTGAVGFNTINGQDITPIVQAMKNTGYSPQFILYSVQYYLDANVQAAKALGTFPSSYVGFSHLAFEMDPVKFPILAQVKSILSASVAKPRFTDFTASSFSAWALWAKEATACGSNLTQDCVLQKAAAETAWTGGGLYAPLNLDPVHPNIPKCWLVIRLTTSGWVYDQKVTNPDSGVYNCDAKNVTTVHSYQ